MVFGPISVLCHKYLFKSEYIKFESADKVIPEAVLLAKIKKVSELEFSVFEFFGLELLLQEIKKKAISSKENRFFIRILFVLIKDNNSNIKYPISGVKNPI